MGVVDKNGNEVLLLNNRGASPGNNSDQSIDVDNEAAAPGAYDENAIETQASHGSSDAQSSKNKKPPTSLAQVAPLGEVILNSPTSHEHLSVEDQFADLLRSQPLTPSEIKKRNRKQLVYTRLLNQISDIKNEFRFERKECNVFIADENADPKAELCMCGRSVREHYEKREKLPPGPPGTKWSADEHTKAVPTNAFGEIHFAGTATNRTAQYIRVSTGTTVTDLVKFAYKHWRLPQPKMIISITGGAGDLRMDKKLKEGLKKGLMKVAVSTGAWMVTGGTNAGIMKLCGEAVHDYILAHGEKDNSLVTIGVATWGIITHKDSLVSRDGNGKFPAEYSGKLSEFEKADMKRRGLKVIECYLDPHHTHFVLVDDGSVGQFGKEMKLRGVFEAEICKNEAYNNIMEKGDLQGAEVDEAEVKKVPIVCVMVEGGPGTLNTAVEALKNETPVVIVEGSGRCADAIAFVYHKSKKVSNQTSSENNSTDEQEEKYIIDPQELEQVYHKTCELLGVKEEVGQEFFDKIMDCVQCRSLLTVFKLDGRRTSTRDIDIAILRSLLSVSSNKFEQLKLALAWNRLDIAKSEIFSDQTQANVIGVKELQLMMYQAVLQAKVPFIQLFIEHGVILKEWLTPKILHELYVKSFAKSGFLKKYLNQKMGSGTFRLKMIGEILRDFISPNYISLYFDEKYSDLKGPNSKPDEPFSSATRELFIYSMLLMRYDMMRFFWEEGTEQIAAGLFASTILRRIALHPLLRNDVDQQERLAFHADNYEELAIGILNQCQEDNDEQTQKILIREQPSFAKLTCIDLAVVADSKRFIAQTGCQSLLNSIWMGRMQPYNSMTTFILALFFPPLILTSIYFTNDVNPDQKARGIDGGQSRARANTLSGNPKRSGSMRQGNRAQTLMDNFNDDSNLMIGRTGTRLTYMQRIIKFYNAPITKFSLNFGSYLFFLAVFSVFVLNQYSLDDINSFESCLCIWVASFAIEEFRQLLIEESERMSKKLLYYVTSFWNLLDLSGLTLFIVGLILRLTALHFGSDSIDSDAKRRMIEWAHTSYVFSLVIYYVRLTHTCSVSQQLGPKIIMIAKMIQDLAFFLFILFVFLISYGVALQAIMFPNESDWNKIFQGIFYYPYWQMFGELFLEEIGNSDKIDHPERCASINDTSPPPMSARPASTLYCESPRHVDGVTIFLAVIYMFFTNILLLNVLIAMFTYTFEQVQERTDLFWKFHLYELIKEYFQRPALPPPLILLQHLFFFIKFILSKCTDRVRMPNYNFKMKIQESPIIQQLIKWEDLNAEEYIRELDRGEREKLEYHVRHAEGNTERILASLVDPMNEDDPTSLSERVQQLESKMDTVGKQLDYMNSMMQFVADAVCKGKSNPNRPLPPPDLFSDSPLNGQLRPDSVKTVQPVASSAPPNDSNKLTAANAQNKPPSPPLKHVKALTLDYYEVRRMEVPRSLIGWDKVWYDYEPPSYTHPLVLEGPAWADLDFSSPEFASQKKLVPWNKLDTLKKVDRRSFMGQYSLGKDDLLPRNPIGRTGLKGRGLLGRWGPNHAADPIVTRWKLDTKGERVVKKGKPVLEFVAITRKDTGDTAIPGGMVDPGEEVSATLLREFMEEAVNYKIEQATSLAHLNREQKLHKVKELFFKEGREIYRGYVDDPRNTDNAWMETVAVNFHDSEGRLKDSQLQGGDDAKSAFWQEISSSLNLYASHHDFIRKTAELHSAHWSSSDSSTNSNTITRNAQL
ncbi:transient receptor potential cation channel subfamily M member-like 2 isoform X2 [Convolutriloba macropyga]|uniref:transient receptor potential cation channel subfamily M member-like 2 isoform X2 n=1 Tax=Convolutriloba macropyga TaxID=536237 RepID=UPI003F5282EA